jgi:DNA processing protein
MTDPRHAWLRFTLTPELSAANQRVLLERFATPEQAFTAPHAEIVAAVGARAAGALAAGPAGRPYEAALKWLEDPNHHLLTRDDSRYPQLLKEIAQPPSALYVRGHVELLSRPSFAIVGSRNATIQGMRDAEAFARALSDAGLAIVSGLALGIDAAAHRGGLGGKSSSIAVLGTGADLDYPRRNRALAARLAESGAIVTEFSLGMPPAPGNFPRRNRIISGLARGVLVVEAASRSGSLITARLAADQGRDVFALPGSIHAPLNKGCHELIKDGAKLVESVEDILKEIRWDHAPMAPPPPARARRDALLAAMGHMPVSIDDIAGRTGHAASLIAARLTMLELEGAVASVSGGFFQRLE